ncbi:MAG: phenylalanine--tRNA ligase subunit beta, partial [Thermodesulfobacteria bacterium]|nr:phenylalanine--tRNA ligase subunit beta [Thermodesulfobacteriota bacterium]
CLSIYGMAREVAAITGAVVRPPVIPELPLGEEIFSETSVVIEVPELCFRYAGRLIKGVKVSESPFEMQKRLWFCGLRPINNVVDVTNYVLLLLGQPLHAFDFDLLKGKRIIVRLARAGEKILTLDGVERELDEKTMVIADLERPVAIAGIMGGEETAVTEKTENVFLESAWFNPSSIRLTSQRLRLSSESSYRFERGIDPEGVVKGLDLAASLIRDLAGGEIVPGRIDEYPRPYVPREIRLSPRRVSLYLKMSLPEEKIEELLSRVEVKVTKGVSDFICRPPSYRHDIALPEDLIEEIARLYGYDRLPVSVPRAEIAGRPPSPFEKFQARLRELLPALGLYEVINYSFISPRFVEILGLEGDPRARVLRLSNPLSEEQSVMRTTLIPGLLFTAQVNLFREVQNLRIFEIGRVFWPREGEALPEERHFLAGLLCGQAHPLSCHREERPLDFFDLKGMLETLFARLPTPGVSFSPGAQESFLIPGLSVALLAPSGEKIGFAGAVKESVLEKLDLTGPVFVFEIDLEKLFPLLQLKKTYRALPKFPATFRDLAILVDDEIPAGEILAFARGLDLPYLEDVSIIDVYRGKGIPEGKKSLTLRFLYRAPERTLRDEEVNEIQAKAAEEILSRFKAQAR